MTRQDAREKLMTILFQMEMRDDFDVDNMDLYLEEEKWKKQEEYAENILSLACNYKDDIDACISKYSTKWALNRIPKTDLAILRLATIELVYCDDIPDSVAINEAVDLSKKYSDEKSPSYINGILASIQKNK